MTIIKTYINGGYKVTIYSNGTKIREKISDELIVHPETMDVKITNYCDLGCSFCHELSTTKGEHADLNALFEKLTDLPQGIELALGGGNPLSHPDLLSFLHKLKDYGFIPNLTINVKHINDPLLFKLVDEELIYGLGVSICDDFENNIKQVKNFKTLTNSDNIVIHLIAGITPANVFDLIYNEFDKAKVLVLGYKTFGRGIINPKTKEDIRETYKGLYRNIDNMTLSFDNLAIEQFNLKKLFSESSWDKFYMGDEGKFSMYIDSVKQEYGINSCATNRVNWKDISIKEFFKTLQ